MRYLLGFLFFWLSTFPSFATTYVYEMQAYLDRNFHGNNDIITPHYALVDLSAFATGDGVSLSPHRPLLVGFLGDGRPAGDFYFGFTVRLFSSTELSACSAAGSEVLSVLVPSGCLRPRLRVFGWIGDFREDGTPSPRGSFWNFTYGSTQIFFERLRLVGIDQPYSTEWTNRAFPLAPAPLPSAVGFLLAALIPFPIFRLYSRRKSRLLRA
jgi:hypothetical protein